MLPTNRAFLTIAKRAERQSDEFLAATFVDYGSILTILSSVDHHIIYGRRGTGKTHLLTALRQRRRRQGELAIQIDMRVLGSAGGIYGDTSRSIPERGTRLLVDVLAAIHAQLFDQAVENSSLVNLGAVGPSLDALLDAHREVRIVGETSMEAVDTAEVSQGGRLKIGGAAAPAGPSLSAEVENSESVRGTASAKRSVKGQEVYTVNFGRVATALQGVVQHLPKQKLWLMFDEWSEVPLDLQPYLADLLRRAVLPARGVVVKIAAIEQRSRFSIPTPAGHIGLEPGADISAAVNLDEFMVFENDETEAIKFFRKLVLAHVQRALKEEHDEIQRRLAAGEYVEDSKEDLTPPAGEDAMISHGFTQANAFNEVVRACEGVPRDALHILHHAAAKANDETISIHHVRNAAQLWYQVSKETAVSASPEAKSLLVWIIDKVIKDRQTKAFLLEAGIRDELIDFLYDERVLHVLRRSVSAKESPGVRYVVYGIDYGCYVDLINTAGAPKGVLDLGEGAADFTGTVPKTDFRSIRRCVLDLGTFYFASEFDKQK